MREHLDHILTRVDWAGRIVAEEVHCKERHLGEDKDFQFVEGIDLAELHMEGHIVIEEEAVLHTVVGLVVHGLVADNLVGDSFVAVVVGNSLGLRVDLAEDIRRIVEGTTGSADNLVVGEGIDLEELELVLV